MTICTHAAWETFAVGKRLGEEAAPGSVFLLEGDLGVGKTVFAQGFAAGLGISGHVTSPTFTILQEYRNGRIPFYHFDLYRLTGPGEVDDLGLWDYLEGDGAVLVEWPELLGKEGEDSRFRRVRIEKEMEEGPDFRRIEVSDAK